MAPTGFTQSRVAGLRSWLAERADVVGDLRIDRLSGGRSNLTYVLGDNRGDRWVLRRPPSGPVLRGAHDVIREYRIVSKIFDRGIPVAEPIGTSNDESLLGAPFAVTNFVRGITLRRPEDCADLTAEGRRRLASNFAVTLASLHALDPLSVGAAPTQGKDYVARQVHVWQRQLDAGGGRNVPGMREVGCLLRHRAPEQRSVAVVHGDYRLDNVLVNPDGAILAVVDWELWTYGDPLADLGAALCYWIDDGDDLIPLGETPTTAPGIDGSEVLLKAYADASGAEVAPNDLQVYIALGLWRFAAILEGVYQRHLAGAYDEPADESWRRFETVVPSLVEGAARLIEGRNR